jgi:hypothetical protein
MISQGFLAFDYSSFVGAISKIDMLLSFLTTLPFAD